MIFSLLLSDGVVRQQFNNQFFHFTVAAADGFALFGLEHDVLDGFYFRWRTGLRPHCVEVTVYVCYAPFGQVQVIALVVQVGIVEVTLLLFRNGFGVFVLLYQLGVARAAGSCTCR